MFLRNMRRTALGSFTMFKVKRSELRAEQFRPDKISNYTYTRIHSIVPTRRRYESLGAGARPHAGLGHHSFSNQHCFKLRGTVHACVLYPRSSAGTSVTTTAATTTTTRCRQHPPTHGRHEYARARPLLGTRAFITGFGATTAPSHIDRLAPLKLTTGTRAIHTRPPYRP
jgi:hypothetical protein